jgi:hypothetical protein
VRPQIQDDDVSQYNKILERLHRVEIGAGLRGLSIALPLLPQDGDEVYFQNAAMATSGIVWHLRYNAVSASAYKWEFLGGQPLLDEVPTQEAIGAAGGTYGTLTTAGPVAVLPLAGDFVVRIGARITAAGDSIGTMSYDIGGTGAVDADGASARSDSTARDFAAVRVRRKNALTAVTLTAKYRRNSANATFFADRWMEVTPVRVG